jgi:hypothetical protein
MAAALGQQNDTKGAQLLLIQEKDGYRAVTYVPDANAKGNVRVLGNTLGVNPETVRTALKETKNMGGFGNGSGILDRIERATGELKREWVNRGGRAAADRMEKTMGEMSKLDDRLGAMTIESAQLGKHGNILGVLLKTAGLDNQATLSAVEAMTQVDGLAEMGAELDRLSQKMGDIKSNLTTVEDLGTLRSLWAEVGALKKEMTSIEKGMKAGELAIDGKLKMALQLENVLKDMIKNPQSAPQGNIQLFDVLRSYKGTPVLPTPTFLRLKAGLVESAPTQLARMGNELEREQLAVEVESLLAVKKDVAGLKEGAVKGDFIENPTGYQILGQILAGLTPAGLAADGRDVIANAGKVLKTGGRENKLMLAMATLGFVPLAGDSAKAILKQTLAKGVGENIDEAAEVVLKAVSETVPQFKDGDEALAALRAGGVELAGVKATLKGSGVVLEMTGKEAKALANDSGRIKALVAVAESKGIGRLSLKITGPEAKEAIQNIKLFNSLSVEGLEPIRVASEKAKWTAKAKYGEAKHAWTTAKVESRRLVNEAETAVKASDGELALAKAQKAEFEELVTRYESKEVSESEFIRQAEGYIEGARPAGDRAGSQGKLLRGDRVQQGGGSHLEGSGRNPSQGSGSVGQSDSPLGRKPSGTGSNVERTERISEASRLESRASRLESRARGLLDSEVQSASAKNGRFKQNLADLRNGKADSLSGAKEAGLGARRARAEYELRRGELTFVEQRIKIVSSGQVQDVVKVDIGLESISPDDIDTTKLFDALRSETAQSGIPIKRWGGLDPGMAVGGTQTPLAGKVPSKTAEAGSQAGTILVYSARTSEGVAESFAQGARRDIMGKSAFTTRHGPGEYVAEQSATAVAEAMGKVGGTAPEAVNVKVLDLASAKVLDYTDPAVAKKMGVERLLINSNRDIAYEPLQESALKARAMGYDVIKFPSAKDGSVNYLVTDNFKDLLKVPSDWTNKGVVGIDRTTIKEAERILKNSEPTTAGMAKTVVMGLGGGLLLGAGARSARAGMADNENPTTVERSGKTMATLGLGTVVDRLSKVDLGSAMDKTNKVLSVILDAGQTAAQSVGSWGTNLVNDVGTILQTQGETMTTRDAPPQTSPRPPTLSAPDTTPLPTLTITPQMGTDYSNALAVETLSSLLGPMPTTPSEAVTAGWVALPIPFKSQTIQVASAMGFNAYGEGRDYHVVGSNQQKHGVGVWKSIANTFATMAGAVRSIFVNSFSKVADWLTGRSAQGLTLKGGELYARNVSKPVKLHTANGGTIEVMAGEGGKIGKLEQGKIVLGEGLTVNGVPVLSGTMTMRGGTGRIESLRLPIEKVGAMEVPDGVYRMDGQGKGWLELPGQSLGLSGGILTLAAESVTSHDVGLGMAYIGGVGTWLSPKGEEFSFVRALVVEGDAGGILLERKGEFFVAADSEIESVTSIAGRIQGNAKVAVADVGAVKALEGRIGTAFEKSGMKNATEKAGQGIKAARLEAEGNLRTAEVWTNLGESGQWEMAALVSGGKMDLGRWETRVTSLERGVDQLAKAETLLKQVEGALTERGLIRAELQEIKGKGEGMFRAGIRDMVKSGFSETEDTLRAKAQWANSVVERGVDFALAEREARNDITAPTDKGLVARLTKWPGFFMEKMLVKGIDLTEDLDTLAAQGDMDAKLTEAFNVFRIAKWGYDKTAELYDRPTGVRVASVWFGLVGRGVLEVANWVVPVVQLGAVTAVVVEHHTEKAALKFGMGKGDAQKWGGWLGLGSGILLFAGTASATTKASVFLNPSVRGAVGESARSLTLGSGKEFAQALGITTGIVVAVEGSVELGGKALGWTRLQIDDGKEVGFMIAGNVVAGVLRNRANRLKVKAEEKLKLAIAEEMGVRGLRNEMRLNLEKRIESVMSSGGGIPAGKTEYNGRLYTKLETKTPAGMLEHNGRLYKALGDGKQTNPRLLENLLSKGGLNANAGRNSQLAEVEDLGVLLQRARRGGEGFERVRTEVRDTGTEVRDTGTEVRRRNERVQRYRDEAGAAYAKALRLERMAEAFDNADTPEGWEPPYSRLSLPGGTANTTSGARATSLLREAQSIINAAWDQNASRQRSAPRDPLLR